MLIVQKFGGSSLADAGKLRKAAKICANERKKGHDVIMVVSASGDRTDELAQLAASVSDCTQGRELDALLSTGELCSAALMAMTLGELGISAASFTGFQAGILTDGNHGSARAEYIAPGRLEAALDSGVVPVVCGFQGISADGNITTLGRGGSDTTAVILAAALQADRCRIYTDVDGIYTADPRIVRHVKRLERVDYADMLLLSRSGAGVLQSTCVELAMANGVEVELLGADTPEICSRVCSLDAAARPEIAGIGVLTDGTVSVVGKDANARTLSAAVLSLSRNGTAVLDGGIENGRIYFKVAPDRVKITANALHKLLIG